MTDLTPNHPAVESLARQLAQLDDGEPWPSNDELGGHHILGTRDDEYRYAMLEEAREVLNAALPHLTADDLRDTPAGRKLMAEAWEEGAQDAWEITKEGWNSEYTGEPGDLSSFRVQNPIFPNPHLDGTA